MELGKTSFRCLPSAGSDTSCFSELCYFLMWSHGVSMEGRKLTVVVLQSLEMLSEGSGSPGSCQQCVWSGSVPTGAAKGEWVWLLCHPANPLQWLKEWEWCREDLFQTRFPWSTGVGLVWLTSLKHGTWAEVRPTQYTSFHFNSI